MFNIPVKGTHAHAYITSFSNPSELKTKVLYYSILLLIVIKCFNKLYYNLFIYFLLEKI